MKTYFFIWQHFQNTSYMSMLNFHCRGGVYKIQTNKNSIKLKILHFERNKKFFFSFLSSQMLSFANQIGFAFQSNRLSFSNQNVCVSSKCPFTNCRYTKCCCHNVVTFLLSRVGTQKRTAQVPS
jgi:hypothetical protein